MTANAAYKDLIITSHAPKHARRRLVTYQPYSIMFGPPPDRSMLAVFMYGWRGFDGVADDTDEVGEGVDESQPFSGELGKTTLSGRAK